MDLPKPKARAIRADPSQTALLKSLFAASPTPSAQAICELSQQTGLPNKWISAWFGRQRTKARKTGTIIGMTTSSSVPTVDAFRVVAPASLSTPEIKAETQETSEPPSSSPRSIAPDTGMVNKTLTKTARRSAPRTRGKRAQKVVIKPEPQDAQIPQPPALRGRAQAQPPKLLPSVLASHTFQGAENELSVQSRFRISTPTCTQASSVQGPGSSIYPQYGLNYPATTSLAPIAGYSSNPGFTQHIAPYRQGPIMRSSFRNSMPSDYRSDSAKVTSHQKELLKPENGRPSSTLDEGGDSDIGHTRSVTYAYEVPSVSPGSGAHTVQDTLSVPPSAGNFPSSAFATYMTLRNHPAVYQAILQHYAATPFPGVQRSWNEGAPAQAPRSLISELSSSGSPYPCAQAEMASSIDADPQRTDKIGCKDSQIPSAVLPGQPEADNDTPEHPYCFTNIVKESQDTPWNTDSDVLDLSSLHYDYAPLNHLQSALEPFRLPESNYLFGREGVADYLLDERLAVEEPFQAAMGLVLLSKLGLEW